MRRLSRWAFAVGAVLLTVACGKDSSGPSPFEVDGRWAGNGSKNGISFALLLNLTEDGQNITGTGGISGSGPMCSMAIGGYREGTKVHLTLACAGFDPFSFVGSETDGSTLSGNFSGSGLPKISVSLHKQ